MRILIAIFAFLLALAPLQSFAVDAPVKTQASAIKHGDPGEVKNRAIEQALKNAVSEALASIIQKEGQDPELNTADITSNAKAYVLNYKVITESWIDTQAPVTDQAQQYPQQQQSMALETNEGDIYNVWVEANIDYPQLRAALSKITERNKAESVYTLDIVGVADYTVFRSIITSIEKIASIKDITYNSFSRGRITIALLATGTAEDLVARMSKEVPDGLEAVPGPSNTIFIKPSKRIDAR